MTKSQFKKSANEILWKGNLNWQSARSISCTSRHLISKVFILRFIKNIFTEYKIPYIHNLKFTMYFCLEKKSSLGIPGRHLHKWLRSLEDPLLFLVIQGSSMNCDPLEPVNVILMKKIKTRSWQKCWKFWLLSHLSCPLGSPWGWGHGLRKRRRIWTGFLESQKFYILLMRFSESFWTSSTITQWLNYRWLQGVVGSRCGDVCI